MKKILIISPHFPPSNLAAVHRARLFARHLPEFGWEPVVLTVHEDFYEEKLDTNLEKLLPANLRVEKVKAFPITRPRLIGDIGIRAFLQLYKRAKQIIKNDGIDFIYIPIPSFYGALLGRWLHSSTGVRYGIDYIDPWVHNFPGSNRLFSRHWFSKHLAGLLEPIAIKNASLITGVAAGYYDGVFERNPGFESRVLSGAMPYGGEIEDHELVKTIEPASYLFQPNLEKIQLVYAGAMLPRAYTVLECVFQSIKQNLAEFKDVEFHFIGTGKTPGDPQGFNIKPLAEKFGLWQNHVFEYPQRIPYLDVLMHLNIARGIFIMGSTEPHYTPSKVYQGILSGKPILAVLHRMSTAVPVLKNSGAGIVLEFDGEQDVQKIRQEFTAGMNVFRQFIKSFDPATIDTSSFEQYSARSITRTLANLLDKAHANSN